MGSCEKIANCPFFNENMANMPAMAEAFRKDFCNVDFKECARYIVDTGLGSDKVPNNLYPNEKERSIKIILEEKPDFKF